MCRLQHRQSLQKQIQENPSAPAQADKGFQCTGLDTGSYHSSSEAQQGPVRLVSTQQNKCKKQYHK